MPPAIDVPVLVHGKIKNLGYTDWTRDYCQAGRPVTYANLLASRDCLSHGGEINSATLTDIRVVNGTSLRVSLKVAFVGHALKRSYSESMYMVLVPSPADFRDATGIVYFVGDRDNYETENKCINNNGHSHLDFRDCPDKEFHVAHGGCISVPEYMSHYAGKP